MRFLHRARVDIRAEFQARESSSRFTRRKSSRSHMKKKPSYKPSGQPIRCAIYARTATVKMPAEDNSIRQQVATCERFARERGWSVGGDSIFTDSGHSGLNVNSALKDLMRSAAGNPKPFEVLLCTSIDRIARDTCLLIRFQKTLRKYGVEIRIVELDTQT